MMHRIHTHAPTHRLAHARACTHTHTPVAYQAIKLKKKVFKRGFQGRFKRADRERMADRNRELVPDNWSLVRE